MHVAKEFIELYITSDIHKMFCYRWCYNSIRFTQSMEFIQRRGQLKIYMVKSLAASCSLISEYNIWV